jgi:hypothetical protein
MKYFLERKANGNKPSESEEELVFYPNGPLVVETSGKPRNPEAIVAYQVAEDGFI